uniref:Uncharacterized protein n=1 Tax=Steinernema glaseri TaxID=37863 RepID=A0A1I8AQ41_9BILA
MLRALLTGIRVEEHELLSVFWLKVVELRHPRVPSLSRSRGQPELGSDRLEEIACTQNCSGEFFELLCTKKKQWLGGIEHMEPIENLLQLSVSLNTYSLIVIIYVFSSKLLLTPSERQEKRDWGSQLTMGPLLAVTSSSAPPAKESMDSTALFVLSMAAQALPLSGRPPYRILIDHSDLLKRTTSTPAPFTIIEILDNKTITNRFGWETRPSDAPSSRNLQKKRILLTKVIRRPATDVYNRAASDEELLFVEHSKASFL